MSTDLDTDPLDVPKPDSLDQLGQLEEHSDRCWLWMHDWGQWEDTESGTINRAGRIVGHYIYQERRCKNCNKVEMNTIKT